MKHYAILLTILTSISLFNCTRKHAAIDPAIKEGCSVDLFRGKLSRHFVGEKTSGKFRNQNVDLLDVEQSLDSCEFHKLMQWVALPDSLENGGFVPPKVIRGNPFLLGKKIFPDGRSMIIVLNDHGSVQETLMLMYDQKLRLDLVFPLALSVLKPDYRGTFESIINVQGDSITIMETGDCWAEGRNAWCQSSHNYSATIDSNNKIMFEEILKMEMNNCCRSRYGLLGGRKYFRNHK